MSIVTYKNMTMSAASVSVRYSSEGYRNLTIPCGRPSIARDFNGVIYGAVGNEKKVMDIINAVQKNSISGKAVEIPMPEYLTSCGIMEGDCEILVSFPDGRLRLLQAEGEKVLDGCEYFAIGHGCEFALGALFAGAEAGTAISAVSSFTGEVYGNVSSFSHSPRGLAGGAHVGLKQALSNLGLNRGINRDLRDLSRL